MTNTNSIPQLTRYQQPGNQRNPYRRLYDTVLRVCLPEGGQPFEASLRAAILFEAIADACRYHDLQTESELLALRARSPRGLADAERLRADLRADVMAMEGRRK